MTNKKVPLQVYLTKQDRDDYNKICKARGIKATEELRAYARLKIKQNKELLND